MGQVKHAFAGSLSSQGFFSFFPQILGEEANRIYLLKGGPGTGKSTLMKKIGEEMLTRGFKIEKFFCSSDRESLDAVNFPQLGVALIDATAPHTLDPKYPGSVDEIINLGEFWRSQPLKEEKERIIPLIKANSACYARIYRYLRAAKALTEDTEAINLACLDLGKINQIAADLVQVIFKENRVSAVPGKVRHLFASAITPQGPVTEIDSIVQDYPKKYILKGEPGTGKSTVLHKLVDRASERGFYVEAFHCPLNPEKIKHISIPHLQVAMVTSEPPHIYEADLSEVINFNSCLQKQCRVGYHETLHKNHQMYEELLERVFAELRKAKSIHDELERAYAAHMDFTKVDALGEKLLVEILNYAKSN